MTAAGVAARAGDGGGRGCQWRAACLWHHRLLAAPPAHVPCHAAACPPPPALPPPGPPATPPHPLQHAGLVHGLLSVCLPLPPLLPLHLRQNPGRPAVQHEVRKGTGGERAGHGIAVQCSAVPPAAAAPHPPCTYHLPASRFIHTRTLVSRPCPRRSARACWRPTTSPRMLTAPPSAARRRSRRRS